MPLYVPILFPSHDQPGGRIITAEPTQNLDSELGADILFGDDEISKAIFKQNRNV